MDHFKDPDDERRICPPLQRIPQSDKSKFVAQLTDDEKKRFLPQHPTVKPRETD